MNSLDMKSVFSRWGSILEGSPPIDQDFLRCDLTDTEYADWFLGEKLDKGQVNPGFFLNDFVLFRVALNWPKNAQGWTMEESDIISADFSLSVEDARDLVAMAREGLTDGYVSAVWYAKVSAMRYVLAKEAMPEELFNYMQELLFLPPQRGSGRKRTDGLDRDRIVRNLVDGLLLRNQGKPSAITDARIVAAEALGRKGFPLTDDAVRKICKRSERSSRETRYWDLIFQPRSPVSSFLFGSDIPESKG